MKTSSVGVDRLGYRYPVKLRSNARILCWTYIQPLRTRRIKKPLCAWSLKNTGQKYILVNSIRRIAGERNIQRNAIAVRRQRWVTVQRRMIVNYGVAGGLTFPGP